MPHSTESFRNEPSSTEHFSTAPQIQQQHLVAKIFEMQSHTLPHNDSAARGLAIYQNNLLATASRALKITYPVIDKLLGDEALRLLARQLLKKTPPASGDWADWGEDLNELLIASPLTDEYPFLPDIATLEWLLHQASRAPETAFKSETLSLLVGTPLETLMIQMAASVQLIESDYPIDIIWRAHQETHGQFSLDTNHLAEELNRHQGPCRLLIYQQHKQPHMQRISATEYKWIRDIFEDHNLDELLDRHPNFEFSHWLSTALENQKIEKLYIKRT